MSKTLTKGVFAWLVALLVALVALPGMALAAEDTDPWASWSDTDVVFKVVTEQADGQTVEKDFTKAEMVQLATSNTTNASYLIKGKKGVTVNTATEYVTLDQLFAAASTTFESGDQITIAENADDPFTAVISYDELMAADRYFYPSYSSESTTDATGAEVVPAIIALKWGSVTLSSGTAGSVVSEAADGAYHSSLRNFWGKTQAEYAEGNLAGKPYVSGAYTITISKPFNVYTRTGAGEKELVKSYYLSDIKALAESSDGGRGFLFNKNGWQVGVTTNYVPLATLMTDAFGDGFTLGENQTLVASAADGFSTTMTYNQYTNAKYFYPATTTSAISADYPEEVGAVLALNWITVAADPTAGAARVAAAAAGDFSNQYRMFVGLASADDTNTGGNRFATGPVEISVTTIKSITDESVSISGIEESYLYTGEAIQPEVTVTDGDAVLSLVNAKKVGDYSVEYGENTEVGKGTVTVTGCNSYTDSVTFMFDIVKPTTPIDGAIITVDEQTYTGEPLEPEPVVTLDGTTLIPDVDYSVSYANNVNAGTAIVTVTGMGDYEGEVAGAFTIAKAKNVVTVSSNSVTKTFKAKKLKSSAKKVALPEVEALCDDDVAWTVTKDKSGGALKLTKAGKIKVKKGTAKGTYVMKLKAVAAECDNYKAASSKVVTVKVTVK